MNSSCIQIRAISQEMPQPSVTEIRLKITYLKLNSNFPGANELNVVQNATFLWHVTIMYLREETIDPLHSSMKNVECQYFNINYTDIKICFMQCNPAKYWTKIVWVYIIDKRFKSPRSGNECAILDQPWETLDAFCSTMKYVQRKYSNAKRYWCSNMSKSLWINAINM